MTIEFIAEIREVKSKKLVSNDLEFSVRLSGESSEILKLGEIPPDQVVKVTIESNN